MNTGSISTRRFITLEGGEGAGKSTQIRMLAAALEQAGEAVTVTREPGGAPGAEEIRNLLVNGETSRWAPLTEVLLHVAARAEHLDKTVLPALERGEWVICDRFSDSTLAYQGYGHGVDLGLIKKLHSDAFGDFAPGLTLILDIDHETGLNRAGGRGDGEDRYERMGTDFHARLREGFLEIARNEPERCVVIDAANDEQAVSREIISAVRQKLGARI